MAEEAEGSQQLSEEEIMRQLEEELRKLKVSDLLVQSIASVSALCYRKLGADERDLHQAKLGIDALRVLVPVLKDAVPEDAYRSFDQTVVNLQLAYAKAVAEAGAGN